MPSKHRILVVEPVDFVWQEGLTSGPGSGRTIEGIDLNTPPALIVLDPPGERLGTWNGRLASSQEDEILAIVLERLGGVS